MPDYSVYVQIENRTNEVLRLLDSPALPGHGHWINIPHMINPGQTSSTFQLKDPLAFAGSKGHLNFAIQRVSHNGPLPKCVLSAHLSCSYSPHHHNKVEVDVVTPKALYAAYFRTSTRNNLNRWTRGGVDGKGHPVRVEITLCYQKKSYRFRVQKISASVYHPIRDSLGVLTRDSKTSNIRELWDISGQNNFADGQRGSFQPNIFGYDFVSQLRDFSADPADPALTITICTLDAELIGAECYVHGRAPGSVVCFQSDHFLIGDHPNVTVAVRITEPDTSSKPFSLNGDVEWGMTLALSGQNVEYDEPKKTRLELYWIAQALHPAFKTRGIPVEFLRAVLPSTTHARFTASSDWKREMTQRLFREFHKIYDTEYGRAYFVVNDRRTGISFNLLSYFKCDESGRPGGAKRVVNCADQAAAVELGCSLGRRAGDPPMTWVEHRRFGYINKSHLVGVTDENGHILVNNPFFSGRGRPVVDINDPMRTMFILHIYHSFGGSDNSEPHVADHHLIYDACCGPYLGDDTAATYRALTIDTKTRLYSQRNMLPGTSLGSLVTKRPGVTCIDGQHQTSPQSLSDDEVASAVLSALRLPAEANSPITYVKWSHLREWIKEVLDDSWCVEYGRVGVGEATAHALWYLKHKGNSDSLKITVYVESPTDADGVLDMAASRQAARQCLANFITSTDAPIQLIWTRGELDEFGEYSVRYADGGRCIIVAAGQTVVEILNSGNSLTAETFEGCARKLLEHTIRRDGPPLTAPIIKRGPFLSMTTGNHDEHPSKLLVHSVDGRFSLYFELDKPIAAANATTEGCAYLFDKYVQEVTADSILVELKMLTRSVMGSHVVKAHFADSDTMISRSQTVEIEVVE